MPSEVARLVADGCHPNWTVTRVQTTDETGAPRATLEALDDRGLVAACRAGDRTAFDILVERHRRPVYALCYRFAGTHEDAADLSQDVFLRAYRGLVRFRGDAAFATWLYRIGVNVCLNRASTRRAVHVPLADSPELASAAPNPAVALLASERAASVRAAVAQLPTKQRTALVLRVFHDLPHSDVAAIMGTTVGAVKANVFHALGNLKRLIAGRAV
jgi:RNA polymerase sigma-70 factor (ECF subfamily)